MNNWLHSAHVSKQQSRQEPKCSNTSTDVEKTPWGLRNLIALRKHLHGRGEDVACGFLMLSCVETPPRTWRRPKHAVDDGEALGNTSTDVEKTIVGASFSFWIEKHLHGREEDLWVSRIFESCKETPPRTWRRPGKRPIEVDMCRNTSTDVEKTDLIPYKRSFDGKHLHGRGEDVVVPSMKRSSKETPPRTWRRLKPPQAEKSQPQKHLHGRGEDRVSPGSRLHSGETPLGWGAKCGPEGSSIIGSPSGNPE